jgi:putative toxin-antitoxin system antitoxin component (TIGR02293 family)
MSTASSGVAKHALDSKGKPHPKSVRFGREQPLRRPIDQQFADVVVVGESGITRIEVKRPKVGGKGALDFTNMSWPELISQVVHLTPLSRHDAVTKGVSAKVLNTVAASFQSISKPEIYALVGLSGKTIGRRGDEALPLAASDTTIDLIEVAALAEKVFGNQADAEAWLVAPAMALDGKKPIDLIATRAGAALVKDQLIRLDYGVYS